MTNCYLSKQYSASWSYSVNPFNAELNPICHLLALLGAHHILHVSRVRVNWVVSLLVCFMFLSLILRCILTVYFILIFYILYSLIETVLQDMIDKLIEIGRCYGMEINVDKTKVMRISRQPFPVKIVIDQKQLENVESFK